MSRNVNWKLSSLLKENRKEKSVGVGHALLKFLMQKSKNFQEKYILKLNPLIKILECPHPLLKNIFPFTLLIIFHTINFFRIIIIGMNPWRQKKVSTKIFFIENFFYVEHKRVIIFPRNDKQQGNFLFRREKHGIRIIWY